MKTKENKLTKSASAKALADRKYHQRIVLAKKGQGSDNRKKSWTMIIVQKMGDITNA